MDDATIHLPRFPAPPYSPIRFVLGHGPILRGFIAIRGNRHDSMRKQMQLKPLPP